MNNIQLRRWLNQPIITYFFLGIQILVFIISYLFPGLIESQGAMFGPFVVYYSQYWRFITPIFIHYGLMHFAVNSIVLYFMGQRLEAMYGHMRYFFIYLLSGAAGNLLSFAFNSPGVQSAGSSTALFGLFGAFVVLGVHYKNNYAIQVLVRQFTLFIGISLLFSLFDRSIDIWGHIGGLLGGALLGNLFGLPQRLRDYSIHVRIISGIALVFLLGFCLFYGFKKYQLLV
ncbi:rhomboid family intramembrane serine protease [Tetragenococcus halophilus]|uniref:Rhomboid family protein n=3 Tax=Tetragenococcus halophilus TaxID=51669 RepID=A0A2H6D3G2_TETHA|nr:rhomboid family intramembrane serine protease [Tetragenococcus halophilus]AOF49277.1 peptidase S54 [Tetragenococcus halophilus]AYW50960.1 rhomboid family intramembrane serine protease [Tetragenococcus halophilus]MCO7026079.1 rhomboid family intramembrane serine protease [Tetragenococcus halophilus]MCO8284088.1 rhomboid family intramembrane serine protease [Tetragenococcus halophilus]MCO8292935.1 rhomboid family intramembrane serine protease [Tetragenococcus halophilus]